MTCNKTAEKLLVELLRKELISVLSGLSGLQSVYLRKNKTKNVLILFSFYTIKEEPEKTASLFMEEEGDQLLFDPADYQIKTENDFKIGMVDFSGRYKEQQINNILYSGLDRGIEHYKRELKGIL